jgi:hypothetical protein
MKGNFFFKKTGLNLPTFPSGDEEQRSILVVFIESSMFSSKGRFTFPFKLSFGASTVHSFGVAVNEFEKRYGFRYYLSSGNLKVVFNGYRKWLWFNREQYYLLKQSRGEKEHQYYLQPSF